MIKEPTITTFFDKGVFFSRVNWWDRDGRYSTKTFEDPNAAKMLLIQIQDSK